MMLNRHAKLALQLSWTPQDFSKSLCWLCHRVTPSSQAGWREPGEKGPREHFDLGLIGVCKICIHKHISHCSPTVSTSRAKALTARTTRPQRKMKGKFMMSVLPSNVFKPLTNYVHRVTA
jgi:hypothetical protein